MCLNNRKKYVCLINEISSFLFTPSQSTGSKYSTSVIAHCSHIRRNISIEVDDECILDMISIDVRCRVLYKYKEKIIDDVKNKILINT